MPHPANAIRSIKLTTMIPEDIHSRLSLFLYSELEGRIPQGSFQSFICARTREFFSDRHLDLSPYVGSDPGALQIHGSPAAISALIAKLQGAPNA